MCTLVEVEGQPRSGFPQPWSLNLSETLNSEPRGSLGTDTRSRRGARVVFHYSSEPREPATLPEAEI